MHILTATLTCAILTVCLIGSAANAQAQTTGEQRYVELVNKPLQAMSNVDLAEYLTLRRERFLAFGTLPDPAAEIGRCGLKALDQPFRMNAVRFDLKASDCVTFLESTLAMALADDWRSYRLLPSANNFWTRS